jgi:hypothetical protein
VVRVKLAEYLSDCRYVKTTWHSTNEVVAHNNDNPVSAEIYLPPAKVMALGKWFESKLKERGILEARPHRSQSGICGISGNVNLLFLSWSLMGALRGPPPPHIPKPPVPPPHVQQPPYGAEGAPR